MWGHIQERCFNGLDFDCGALRSGAPLPGQESDIHQALRAEKRDGTPRAGSQGIADLIDDCCGRRTLMSGSIVQNCRSDFQML